MPTWEAAEATHIAACQLCADAITTRAAFTGPGCHIHIGGGDPGGARCPHPPITTYKDIPIPGDQQMCGRHWHETITRLIARVAERN